MIEITINGGTRNQRKYAYSMAYYCIKKFLPKHKTLNLTVNLKQMRNDENYGYCCHLDGREFEVEVKRTLKLRDMLTTLAHEMVHVKQYVLGEMPKDITVGDYWDRPHEIEAHGREVGLFVRWCEQDGYAGKKWANIP
jgi:hypothetical protein